MDTSSTITTIKTIIITRDNTTFESNKVNSKECKISKLNNVWNNYNKRSKYIENNETNFNLTGDLNGIESKESSNINGRS